MPEEIQSVSPINSEQANTVAESAVPNIAQQPVSISPRQSHLLPILLSSLITALILVGVYVLLLTNNSESSDVLPSPITSISDAPASEDIANNPLPQGWTYLPPELCGVSFATPPYSVDEDNRKWVIEKGEELAYGLWSGESYRIVHRNPEEASGFVSGIVSLSCGKTKNNETSAQLITELRQHLESEKAQYDDSEFIIQISSTRDIEKWGMSVKEMMFSGGMYATDQKYYLFTKDSNWFLITSKSDSASSTINQQTQQILDLLTF